MILPPGTILQRMYLRERLRGRAPGRFVEVGVGHGALSRLLLDLGWTGVGFDLNPTALEKARCLTADAIAAGRYALREGDWLGAPVGSPADLVLSSMVLEHFSEADETRYFARTAQELAPGGVAILLVPASPRHWGVEDEIAGHHRRYSFETMTMLLARVGWRPIHLAGLTYPLGNLLRPLSDYLVERAEGHKRALDTTTRTAQSGDRDVAFKTRFPAVAGLVLNERTLALFHRWQMRHRQNPRALVLYVECRPEAAPRA